MSFSVMSAPIPQLDLDIHFQILTIATGNKGPEAYFKHVQPIIDQIRTSTSSAEPQTKSETQIHIDTLYTCFEKYCWDRNIKNSTSIAICLLRLLDDIFSKHAKDFGDIEVKQWHFIFDSVIIKTFNLTQAHNVQPEKVFSSPHAQEIAKNILVELKKPQQYLSSFRVYFLKLLIFFSAKYYPQVVSTMQRFLQFAEQSNLTQSLPVRTDLEINSLFKQIVVQIDSPQYQAQAFSLLAQMQEMNLPHILDWEIYSPDLERTSFACHRHSQQHFQQGLQRLAITGQ